MNDWTAIAIIALLLTALVVGYVSVRKPFNAPPESPASKAMAIIWIYVSAFIVTAIVYGIIEAMFTGYDLTG